MASGLLLLFLGSVFFILLIGIAVAAYYLFFSGGGGKGGNGKKPKPQPSVSSGGVAPPSTSGIVFTTGSGTVQQPGITNKGVILYKDENYAGASAAFGSGDHTLIGSPLKNVTTSLQVSPGCKVTIFDKDDYSGNYMTFTQSTPTLKGTSMNDDIASLRVECT